MDGRRRFLRSLGATQDGFTPAAFAAAGRIASGLSRRTPEPARLKARPRGRRSRTALPHRILAGLAAPAATYGFVAALLLGTAAYGVVRGGHYDSMIAAYGEPRDILAKAIGLRIKAVTIIGQNELNEAEILDIAGIGPRNSLPFLDVAKVRERLRRLPLIKEVSVAKLYPDRLLIEIEERQAAGLWQNDGAVNVVAADGMPLDAMRDRRFINLPLVVGTGANERLGDYLTLLDVAGDLKERVRAGVLVSGRRWNLRFDNGVDVLLPEAHPEAAVATLARLQREAHVLDKAVLSIDMRLADRVFARLTDEAAAERAERDAHKPKGKAGQT